MNLFKFFLERITGRRIKRPVTHAASHHPLSSGETSFFGRWLRLSKWADVEYYGPGAAEAEARRRRRLGLETEESDRCAGTIPHDVRPD